MKTTKTLKTLILGASVLALGLGAASQTAHAAQASSQYVENVDIDLTGMAAIINIENASANKHLNALDLDVKTTVMQFEVAGLVECKGSNVMFKGSKHFFGPVNIMDDGGAINSASALYDKTAKPGYTDSDYPNAEYGGEVFTVPLNQVKNGHPALRVDPLEELEKARQAFNGTDLEFYQQDQELVLQRPISLSGACGKKNNPNKASLGYETKDHTIQIKYKGDPGLNETPVLNAQLQGGGGVPNQFDEGDQPFILNGADFMANLPHYNGKCLPDANPMIRFNYTMGGNQLGNVQFRVVAKSNQYADYGNYYESKNLIKNPANGNNNAHIDFEFPLKEMLAEDKYSFMMILNNKTYNHNMQLEARFKPKMGNWSQWDIQDTAVYKHRCVPQLNGQLQGGNGQVGGYADSDGGETPKLGKFQAKPARAPLGKAAPAEPAPKPKRAPLN